jgi:small acid-soluble spore protein D (minor alpha/beta-type SASP)
VEADYFSNWASYPQRRDNMARRNRNKILVPEARNGLDALKAKVVQAKDPEDAKFEAAEEVGVPLKKGYNGQLTSQDAGKVGGRLGGSMVRELVKMAQENMAKKR